MHITFVATRKNRDPQERELYEMDLMLRVMGLKRAFADLGLLTVAACTPPGHTQVFVDEYLEPIDYDIQTDLVAMSAKTSCAGRAYEVADRFRAAGKTVVLGGIHASLRPEEALEHVDCVVIGEAEAIWPSVVADAAAGQLKKRYDPGEYPPMDAIPDPAWELVDSSLYLFQQAQTTRGCPFTCRFCSVPDISGQSFRFKPVDNILRELKGFPKKRRPLARNTPLYVVDDNFLSRKTFTEELLRGMQPAFEAGEFPHWSAETTLNVASDEALLDAFVAAGCDTLIIGLESVSEETLKDMAKPINFCLTFPQALERIHDRGLSVVGNFIVGFDTDAPRVFADTLDFIQDTGILYPFFSILNPMPGTKLFDDVKAEGRLYHENWELYDTRHVVMEPAQMSPEMLQDGYIWLYEQAYASDLAWERVERQWERYRRIGMKPRMRGGRLAKAGFTALLAKELFRGDAALRRFFGQGLDLLTRKDLVAEPGQLMVMFDSYDFSRFMDRYKSPDYARHAEIFASRKGEEARLQWQNDRARRRSGAAK